VANKTPNLRNLATVPSALLRDLPAVPRDGVELFLVTAEGTYEGQKYAVGELIVCRGEARNGDTTVLVPKGHGRPRLGRIVGTRYLGDAQEPCHPARWAPAGRVVARYRRVDVGWIIELQDGGNRAPDLGGARVDRNEVGGLRPTARAAAEEEGKASSAATPPKDPPPSKPSSPQLSLFVA
jgi:hypothetical protein